MYQSISTTTATLTHLLQSLPSPFLTASADNDTYSPLHVASRQGHMAIIVALVEEGGADVNIKGGERGDTPLMLSVSPS